MTTKGELLECTEECSLLADYARELFQGAGLCEPLAAEWFAEESWVKALPCYALRRRRRRVQLQGAHAESVGQRGVRSCRQCFSVFPS